MGLCGIYIPEGSSKMKSATMKSMMAVTLLFVGSAAVGAQAQGKSCEELKAEIAKKIEANGVKTYSLDIVAKDQDAEGKVVGACEGGAKKIVYNKTAIAAPAAAKPDASKP